MTINLKNVFCNPEFYGHRYINIKYVANCVEISDTKGNDICSFGVTKFSVTHCDVLFYFVQNGEICQFLNGEVSTDEKTFEKSFCQFDKDDLFSLAQEYNSIP